MKRCFLSLILLASLQEGLAQKLNRADRATLDNIQAHIGHLEGSRGGGWSAGTAEEGSATSYIIRQFERDGLRPHAANDSWLQPFEIDEGKTILPATCLVINGDSLRLFSDYTVVAFSANDEISSVVSAALAERGVPWFKDFREVIEGTENADEEQIRALIRKKAEHAAAQGASALLVYNTPLSDALFQKTDSSRTLNIPIVLISDSAGNKYLSDEPAVLDIHLKVALANKTKSGTNILGYVDNAADSIIIASAHRGDDTGTAALIELARLTGRLKPKKNNYLFIVYSGQENGVAGEQYYQTHPCVDPRRVSLSLRIGSTQTSEQKMKGLTMVKNGMALIQHKQSR